MKNKARRITMRSLHRDIGYLSIGLTIIFVFSGIVLIYRDTNFLKYEKTEKKELAPNLSQSELSRELHIRNLKVLNNENNILYFSNGTYNTSSGVAIYTTKLLPGIFQKINSYHKQPSEHPTHILSVFFGILLLFLAISSFWMYKPGARNYQRGFVLAGIGILIAVVIVFL